VVGGELLLETPLVEPPVGVYTLEGFVDLSIVPGCQALGIFGSCIRAGVE